MRVAKTISITLPPELLAKAQAIQDHAHKKARLQLVSIEFDGALNFLQSLFHPSCGLEGQTKKVVKAGRAGIKAQRRLELRDGAPKLLPFPKPSAQCGQVFGRGMVANLGFQRFRPMTRETFLCPGNQTKPSQAQPGDGTPNPA